MQERTSLLPDQHTAGGHFKMKILCAPFVQSMYMWDHIAQQGCQNMLHHQMVRFRSATAQNAHCNVVTPRVCSCALRVGREVTRKGLIFFWGGEVSPRCSKRHRSWRSGEGRGVKWSNWGQVLKTQPTPMHTHTHPKKVQLLHCCSSPQQPSK